MADFIAVIRRAVDGLANNTPEMRAKVYDKARSAVLRQLENMSPRPPEDMIRRQMDKLTAAIEEVEAEHAVALPEIEEPYEPEPEPEVIAPAEPEPVAEDVVTHSYASEPEVETPPAPPRERYELSAPDDYVVATEPEPMPAPRAYDNRLTPEPEPEVEPEPERIEPPVRSPVAPPMPAAPAFATADDWTTAFDRKPAEEPQAPVVASIFEPAPPVIEPVSRPVEHAVDDILFTPAAPVRAEPVDDLLALEPRFPEQPPLEPASAHEPLVAEPKAMTRAETENAYDAWASFPTSDSGSSASERKEPGSDLDWLEEPTRDAGGMQDDFDSFVSSGKPADGPAMPAAIDLLDWHNELASLPPLSGPRPAAGAATAVNGSVQPAPAKPVVPPLPQPPVTPKGESFEDLLGDGFKVAPKKDTGPASSDIEDFLAAAQQSAYRQDSKPRRNFVPLILALAGIILVGGSAYAVWLNRDAITNLVTELTASSPDPATNGTATTQPASTPAPASTGTETATAPTPAATPATPSGAPEEGVTTVQKFTQRLKADGTEVDEGAAGANGVTGEGRSVAQQTVAPTDQQPGATPSTPTAPAPAGTTPPAATGTMPVGSQERAFLYEERLGQVSPTAIVGTIDWTALRETGPDGRPDPAIQGKLAIADRGLNALITFRRNNDNSLPASHLVEIVFSMPADFEGGAIDAVQRVAMKRTEQDRGDPLVGVAAKVTDDTFLIALNDFPDVVSRNMDLMATRNWIDIPITYRNGRRALLTLDKGTNGGALFQQVVREWQALGG